MMAAINLKKKKKKKKEENEAAAEPLIQLNRLSFFHFAVSCLLWACWEIKGASVFSSACIH